MLTGLHPSRPLTSLGFTEDPASWSVEVERILTGISGSARLVAVQQICATAQVFRGRQLEKETGGRLADIVLRGLDFRTTLQMVSLATLANLATHLKDASSAHQADVDQFGELRPRVP